MVAVVQPSCADVCVAVVVCSTDQANRLTKIAVRKWAIVVGYCRSNASVNLFHSTMAPGCLFFHT